MDRRPDQSLLSRIAADAKARTFAALLTTGVLAEKTASFVYASPINPSPDKTLVLKGDERTSTSIQDLPCVPSFYIPGTGLATGGFHVTVERRYWELDKDGTPSRNITQELMTSDSTFDELEDDKDTTVREMKGLQPTYWDLQLSSLENPNNSKLIRASFGRNTTTTAGRTLVQKDGGFFMDGDITDITDNAKANDFAEVIDKCSVTSFRRVLETKLQLVFQRGLRDIKNGVKRIAEQCNLFDQLIIDVRVRRRGATPPPPPPPTTTETPRKEQLPGPPAQAPAQAPGTYQTR